MTPEETLRNIYRTYLLANAQNIHMEWLKNDVKPEFKKAMQECMAKNNYMMNLLKKSLSIDAIRHAEKKTEKLVDIIFEKV
jgi:hypothetical protein